ncbi:MAG: type II toxin-antitoxin system RnlA family toxin [Clostridiales bacterium]|nr:type II toxin-antitoxin system RnlA family toxin [Clostridiales bacterium]
MHNIRYNISPCSQQDAETFIGKIDKAVYTERATVKADMRSHYDRYTFSRGDSKIAVVYDTSASVISITAPEAFADELLSLFSPGTRTVKRSTVPAQNTVKHERKPTTNVSISVEGGQPDTRAKLFMSPDAIKRRPNIKPTTVLATSKGLEISTDEIFPPQRSFRRTEQGSSDRTEPPRQTDYGRVVNARQSPQKAASVDEYFEKQQAERNVSQPLSKRPLGRPKKATISFGDDDEDSGKTLPVLKKSGTGLYADIASHATTVSQQPTEAPQKRKRGRPRKEVQAEPSIQPPTLEKEEAKPAPTLEYKNGYSVKNFPEEKLNAMLKRLKSDGYTVKNDGTEFAGTSQEVKMFIVSDASGAKVYLRYATKKMTLQLQGRKTNIFGEIQAQVSRESDYSSALENYIESSDATSKTKVSDVDNKLKKRLPTAYGFLSEQSRIDFSYGLHDFSQDNLTLSDYSGLLVPPYRGLERFVFDLQRAEGIKVKMIGQAYDKDDSGKYVLKKGYRQRIGSVVYCEVMVALYTEYFSQRNFYLHSDNTDDSKSRGMPDRNVAKNVFENLLNVVEYNAKKLKEIGFSISPDGK